MNTTIAIVHMGTGKMGVLVSEKDAYGRLVVRFDGDKYDTTIYASEIFIYG